MNHMRKVSNIKLLLAIIFISSFVITSCSWVEFQRDKKVEQKPEVKATQEQPKSEEAKQKPVKPAQPARSSEAEKSEAKPVEEEEKAVVEATPLPLPSMPKAEKIPAESPSEPTTAGSEKTAPEPMVTERKEEKTGEHKVAPIKKGPNEFIITVGQKDPSHPFYGQGSPMGFLVDNVEGKTIVLRRGKTYTFDVETNPKHDVYFSTNHVGWGGGVVTHGIKGQFTYKGTITVTPDENTPDVMYYACRNHSTMGGKVYVVDKNATDAQIKKLLASSNKESGKGEVEAAPKTESIPESKVKQKIAFAEMMMSAKAAKRVMASSNKEAKSILSSAKKKVSDAKGLLASGDRQKALAYADESLRLVSEASRLVPSEEVINVQRTRYNELLDAIKNFKQSHKETYERTVSQRGAAAGVDYDRERVDILLNEAKGFADKGEYKIAAQYLENAELMITTAIHGMLNAQTIVYDLNFKTAEEEYNYEAKRFKSYEELVPVAIEQKKPAPGAVKLMDSFVEKGRFQQQEAIKKAKSGDFPVAITMMQSATEQIRRALRIAGVSQ